MIKYLIFGLAMVISTMSYGLTLASDRCKFYFPGKVSGIDDPDFKHLIKIVKPGEAVEVCAGSNRTKVYAVASAISRKNNVSYFYLTRVFKMRISSGYSWGPIPRKGLLHLANRETYMYVGNYSGLVQGDDKFVQVRGLTTRLFLVLNKAWGDILSSEKLFDEASKELSLFAKLSSDVKTLRHAAYRKGDKIIPKMYSVTYSPGSDSRFPYFTFSVKHGSRYWDIDFDFDGNSIKFEVIKLVSG